MKSNPFKTLLSISLLWMLTFGFSYAQASLDYKHLPDDSLVTSKVNIQVGGQLRLNTIYDFNALQNLEAFNILSIPTGDNHNTSPRFSMGIGQSRIKMNIAYNSDKLGPITSYFEGDFLGNGFINFRMRLFYIDIKNWRVGEAWSVFSDDDAWPDVIDFDGPPTGAWARTSQIRYTKHLDDKNKLAFAIETPQTDITQIAALDSTIEETFQGFPDVTAHWNTQRDWGHVQLALIYRKLHYLHNNKTLSNNAGGASLSGHINIREKDKLILQATAGSGIASYLVSFMGGGYDAVTESNGVLSNIPVYGGYAAYELALRDNLKSTWVYGHTHMSTDIDNVSSDFWGYYFSGNLFWFPDEKITVGIEGQYGKVNDFESQTGDATRIQAMLLFNF